MRSSGSCVGFRRHQPQNMEIKGYVNMDKQRSILFTVITSLLCALTFSSCAVTPKTPALKVIIIPKFEIGEMSGDFPGEAQLFYEKYCMGCEEVTIPNMSKTGHFYVNEDTGVGMLVTGEGKTAAGLSLMALLSSGLYDYSDAYIVSVGCGGGNWEECALGDVVLEAAVCDYDLGHHVDAHEKENSDTQIMWFGDDSFADYEYEVLNEALYKKAYKLIKDVPLRTTEMAKTVMKENFGHTGDAALPSVRIGTSLTGDNFWKGEYGHETAKFMTEYYDCYYPYMVTEMEDVALANAADCFDMRFRMISLRVIVNMDVFLEGETPESTWGEYTSFGEKVINENAETLDIFEPAMQNLFDTGSIVIDAILNGTLNIN